jgi:arylsulfatase A-like enzyme
MGVVAVVSMSSIQAAESRPNVLFIAIDDLRDWVGFLGDTQTKTPNLDRLAARGMKFTRSYCAAPVCNPSRTALLTGMRPGATGVYNNNIDWREVVPENIVTLPLHFKNHGYFVAGAGKITHDSFKRRSDWDEYLDKAGGLKDIKDDVGGVDGIRFGAIDADDDDMPDAKSVKYISEYLAKKHDKPFFLACGFKKPHMPFSVPKKYFDKFPLDKIKLPEVKEDDLKDVPPGGIKMAKPDGDHAAIIKSGRWKEAVQAYLATINFMDTMLGRLLDNFDRSPHRANTIIVLWSDHGWHLGEKEHWRKFALWEEATRAPLIWSVPNLTPTGSTCERPVDFMHIYPTLCDLCGPPTPKHLQGQSIRALLKNPKAEWSLPAITTHEFKNHAVRTERWRFIRYANGDEELYDHDADPHEWTNLASDPKLAAIKSDLANLLPTDNVPAGKKSDAEADAKQRAKAKKKSQ